MSILRRERGPDTRADLAVSVIVAAYNTGAPLHELVASLDGQSLPQDHFEVIVVDDGSTDGTAEVLDELAAARDNWVVRHIPNSGWPGTARNLGLTLAQGEFVTFLDHDDYLGPRALETAHAYARTHGSDVVVAREVGVGRSIGRFMFVADVPDATFENSPIIRLLTPHKLYRRDLLERHGIRFPEGRVRLEDHQFTMQAYFAARRVSIFVGHPFYYWTRRDDVSHASLRDKDPHEYVEVAVNRVLDIVEENTAPGDRREVLMSHWLERKLLPIVARPAMLRYAPDYREEIVGAVRRLVLQRYPHDADRHLNFSGRLRVHLLRAGRLDPMMALARAEADLTTQSAATGVTWDGDDLRVDLSTALAHRDGTPVTFRREGSALFWEPGEDLGLASSEGRLLDAADDLPSASALLVLQARDGHDERAVPLRTRVSLVPVEPAGPSRVTVVVEGTATVPANLMQSLVRGDARHVVDLRTELDVLGWRSLRRVAAPQGSLGASGGSGHAGLPSLETYVTAKGNLSVKGQRPTTAPAPGLRSLLRRRLHRKGRRTS